MTPEQTATTGELALAMAAARSHEALDAALYARATLESLPPGIYYDLPEQVYHQRLLGYASKSALDEILRSPARYRAWLEGTDEVGTRALSMGTAVHVAMTEPERFARSYVIEPDFGDLRAVEGRTTKEQGKDNKIRRDAWRLEHAGATILRSEDGQATLRMVRAVAAHPTARALLLDGQPEVTLLWRDAETGLRVKARVDYWLEDIGIAIDIKTTTDARPGPFARSIETYRYHGQQALYVDGFRACGAPVEDFLFMPIEKDGAHDLDVYILDEEDVAEGREDNRRALRLLSECFERNEWPGYAPGIKRITRPAWARKARR
jgi:hypothetical protein